MESCTAEAKHHSTSPQAPIGVVVAAWFNRWLVPAGVTAAAIGFALANGMQYGRSNHWQYLLHGLHAADPNFLKSDWFATQTESHHRLFNIVVRLAASTGRPEVVLGLLNGAAGLCFAFSLYFIVARFANRPLVPFALVLLLAAGVPINGLGDSNILLPYFVPSVFGGVMLLAALACLLYSRDAAAGLLAAAGCAMHANYLMLVGPLWLLVFLLDGSGRTRHRAAWLIVPWMAAWIPHVGYFLAMLRDPAPSAEARRIFWDVYAPFHYRPLTWNWRDYANFSILLVGGLIAAVESRIAFGQRPRTIVAALASVVALGAIGTIGWPVDPITAVFTWRLAPFLTLFALIAIALAATEGGASPLRRLALAVIMAMVLRLSNMPITSCAAVIAASAFTIVFNRIEKTATPSRTRLITAIGLGITCFVAAMLARYGLWRRDMFGRAYPPAEESLFGWCRENTDRDAVFIIPPNLTPFRLEARRAVVIDWKCMPLLPHDQIEWMRRQERLAGRQVNSEADAMVGYAEMDAPRAMLLARDFGCRYLVVDRKLGGACPQTLRRVYSNGRFDIFEVDTRVAALRR